MTKFGGGRDMVKSVEDHHIYIIPFDTIQTKRWFKTAKMKGSDWSSQHPTNHI